MKIRYLICVALFIGINAIAQTNIDEKLLDEKLKDLQEITKTVGFSVAIVKGNEVVYSKGFGYRDLENKLPVDEHTLFAIGSTTKAFTTALLGIMEDEKGLKFSESPKKYLPKLEFFNDELNTQITILDMVCHRTGLPRHDFSWYFFPSQNKDSLLARIQYQEPFTGIRKQWHYNNFMFLAQGMITESLTGKSWEENIRERFFIPLQMNRSNLSIDEMEKQSNISKGYNLENQKPLPYYHIGAISPAGSINSSAQEMANWIKVWLNEGKLEEKEILPQSYVAKAINPLIPVGNAIPDKQFPDLHLQ